MLAVRIFLGLCALLWTPYALSIAIDPAVLSEQAGLAATSATGRVELRAMYGGLQAAIGLVALAGAVRPALARFALHTLGVACAGLGLARLGAALLAGDRSSYTAMALALELGTLALVLALWRRAGPARATGNA